MRSAIALLALLSVAVGPTWAEDNVLTTNEKKDGWVLLFDGKSLDGWEIRPGEEKWWKVQDGMITGGSLEEKVPFNTFLATKKRYENFELKLKVRLTQGEGFMNSGVQLRSRREADNSEMVGYQVDAGTGWWGKLYDESRRNKVVGEPRDAEAIKGAAKDWDWNEYRIRCEGPRIRSWINGVAALDYKEEDGTIPLEGLIGLQTHGGGKVLAQFKDITIQELPPTPNSPKWEDASNRSAEREIATFKVPEGFEVELVASEKEGVGKPITMAWDHSGKMWTMTALEYPVDANESPDIAKELYASRARDKVLVFERDAPLLNQEFVLLIALVPVLRLVPMDGKPLLGAWPYVTAQPRVTARPTAVSRSRPGTSSGAFQDQP